MSAIETRVLYFLRMYSYGTAVDYDSLLWRQESRENSEDVQTTFCSSLNPPDVTNQCWRWGIYN